MLSEFLGTSTVTSKGPSSSVAEVLDPTFVYESEEDEPEFLKQEDVDFIVARGRMPKKEAEFTASYLKKKKLTDHVIATAYRQRQRQYEPFFTKFEHQHEPYAYCNNIPGLFTAMKMDYIANDWRLFVDGSTASLKAILLHKTNLKPPIPVYFATGKVISLLCGAKGGNASFPCFKCDWNSHDKENDQYTYQGYTNPNPEIASGKNGGNRVPLDKVLMPPLHIKLGIVQKFLKLVFVTNDKAYRVLKDGMFKRRSENKVKGGTVNGPEIRKIMRNTQFEKALNAKQ